MSTVPNAPLSAWSPRFDPLRRRDEYADVWATASVRPEVHALAMSVRRGLLDLVWLRELFAGRAASLVAPVCSLDRVALREAYGLLLLEEPLITAALEELVRAWYPSGIPLFVLDAIADVVGSVTNVDKLAREWTWFVNGDDREV